MGKKEKRTIFREKALQRLSSPEQLDKLLPLVKPRTWIALLTTLLLVVSVIIWSFLGKIDTIARGQGIYLDFSLIHSITIPTEGQILEILITPGAKVHADQVIAMIWDEKNQKKVPVISPYNGIILDLFAETGSQAALNAVLVNVQHHDISLDVQDRFYCFFPAIQADRIKEGMVAKINPWSVDRKVYGEIIGEVEKISYLPASDYYFKSIFISDAYAKSLMTEKVMIPIIVNPYEDPENKGQFEWTSNKGPSKKEVTLGSFASIDVVIDSRAPITYIFPFLHRKKLEKDFHQSSNDVQIP